MKNIRRQRTIMGSHNLENAPAAFSNGLIPPYEYVAYKVVERLFRSERGFSYFMRTLRNEKFESKGGMISYLSIPIQEMRQHKNDICMELFGVKCSRELNMEQRMRLAKTLRARYNCSLKQITRLSGLIYDEVKDIIR